MTAPIRLAPRAGVVRGVRAAVLTVPTVGGAALAHASVDGCDSAFALLLAAGACWPAAVALLGARRRVPAFIAWVLSAQIATHLLLEAMCPDVVSGRSGWSQHLLAGASPAMLLSHAAAAVVTGVLLGRADAGLWAAEAIIRAAARALGSRPAAAAAVTPLRSRRTRPVLVVDAPRSSWVAGHPARRGPPVLLASAQ